MSAAASHLDGGEALIALAADVPASAQAASVAIVSGGAAIATRTRSAHPPTVRVTAPASGTTVGASGVVRWVAKDADSDALAATVAYSLDDGKHWRTIYSGPSTGSAKLPGAYFSASRRARVLVRVNDGFDERGARSGRFRARGVPPVVRLRSPAPGTKLLSSSTLVLEGEAFDDASQPLTGKQLVWFAGKRRLGSGAALSTADLSPGKQRLRLVATDRMGRQGTATVTVAVAAVAPQLLELSGPKKVSRRARKVTLRLAVNTRSKLTANGRALTVGRRTSRVTLPIRPGPQGTEAAARAAGRQASARRCRSPFRGAERRPGLGGGGGVGGGAGGWGERGGTGPGGGGGGAPGAGGGKGGGAPGARGPPRRGGGTGGRRGGGGRGATARPTRSAAWPAFARGEALAPGQLGHQSADDRV